MAAEKVKLEKEKIGLGPLKRYGVRYGKTTKVRAAKIEFEQRKPQHCPSCLKPAAKRVAVGIYQCRKCNAKFTGRAYSVTQALERTAPAAAATKLELAEAELLEAKEQEAEESADEEFTESAESGEEEESPAAAG